ncbi:Cytochrome P450 [Dillenia turbinata]|uniref:Cytochrome P450 n=1 Tax=Dillenia turbinata TaxID=194707 RepID=A0AAN8V4I3_9MAGN
MDQQELLQQHVQQAPKTHTFDPFVVCLVFLALLLIPKLKGIASNVKLPPSPPKLPLIGNLHQLRSSPNHTLGVLSKKYGPLMLLHFGQTPTLVVSSPEVAMDIMKTHDMTFANRHQSVAANTFFYGCKELAFSPYGEYWRELKRLCVSELLSSKRTESFQFIREEETANLIEKIREACVEKVPVNLSELIISTANNIICRCVLGKKYEGDEAGTGFGQVSLKAMDLMLAFSFREFFPFIGWMDNFTGYNRKLKEIFNEMDGFLEQVVKKHENNIIKNEQSEKKNFDSMDQHQLLQQHVQPVLKTPTFDPFVVCLVFLAVLLIPKLKGMASNVKLPPSPQKLPLVGNLHQLGSSPNHSLGKYGPLMLLHIGQTPTVVVSSPETAMDIMKTHDVTFANKHQSVAANTFFYGCKDLSFSPYGDEEGARFGQASLKAMDLMLAFSFREFFPSIGWMDNFTGYNWKMKEIFKEMDGFLDQEIKMHENNMIKSEQSEKKNFVEILLRLEKDGDLSFELTREGIKGLILNS